jgi:hypothetical protein
MPLSNLKQHRDNRERLSGYPPPNLSQRIAVTVGHDRTAPGVKPSDNEEYVTNEWPAQDPDCNREGLMVYKPLGGFFDFRRKADLDPAESFNWPPQDQGFEAGHSAPGRLLMVADRLLDRAEKHLADESVESAIFSATLALEAKELLAGKTPTTTLKALSIQHQAEVVAESKFQGVEYSLNVSDRFEEIEAEVESIGRWFDEQHRERSKRNARLNIAEQLAQTFNDYNQFEEEQECLREARKLYFTSGAKKGWWSYITGPVVDFLVEYVDFTLRSIPHFLFAVTTWILIFALFYSLFDYQFAADWSSRSVWDAITGSSVYFFTQSAANPWNNISNKLWLWNLILTFQAVISFAHLGIFISYIYNHAKRKS